MSIFTSTYPGTNDTITVETDRNEMFVSAKLNGNPMKVTDVKNYNGPVDLNRLAQAINQPTAQTTTSNFAVVATTPAIYAYCTPIKDYEGIIIKWVCGGTGTLSC